MMRFLLLATLLFASSPAWTQKGNPAGSEAPLREQYDAMIDASNRYQSFRVVRMNYLNAFMGNVSDSIQVYTDQIAQLRSRIDSQEAELSSRATEISTREGEIKSLTSEKDSISLLGIDLSKGVYHTIMWTLVFGLLGLLLFALARTRLAVASTNKLELNNEKLSAELESSRKRRLEVEQNLRRQLQDEINKRNRPG